MRRFLFVCLVLTIVLHTGITASAENISQQNVRSYKSLLANIYELRTTYPSLVEVTVIGKSTFGHSIPALKIGTGKKHVLFVGSHHGREWLTTTILMKMIKTYIHAYKNGEIISGFDPRILDTISIWFVPMLNPDGVMIQQNGLSDYPIAFQQLLLEMNNNDLNFKKWKANGIGIDLNRQYPAGWDELKGTNEFQSYQFYKGNRPMEADEVASLVQFTQKINPLISVSYHSSGRVLYWHYKNDPNVVLRDHSIAKKFANITGYELAEPPKEASGGGFTDWFIQDFNRPGFTPEISYEVKETNPPLSVFNEEWERNQAIGLMIATEAKKMALNEYEMTDFQHIFDY